ncbi:pyridoxamine 5'-phosphate oxidase family protein [Streptomyces montanisoli]|uniref:Pyridoxamine 5'-phosphate oxidase family protein n=1 Tax=Streptomyces montanisoli TaxID=2798581 RepID=A0A940MG45_9ACTN|nr:pyridoxamine 5'-phosphate oxidase family protein [Streptomyces montanisoli]MBP0458566.1 pyridoxamine 5'-phosphate oxidase family protein [Streptomyces montanisoli]
MSGHYDDASPSLGERLLQRELGTTERATAFYDRQVHAQLTPAMARFIARQSMVFLSTADAAGRCDTSFRAGPPGFVEVLDDHTVAYPEYRGNGVMASAGNVTENPHIGLLFMDFTQDHIGLHVNGTAHLRADSDQRALYPGIAPPQAAGRAPMMWLHITVHEAYVHCSRHIPHLQAVPRVPRARGGGRNRPKDADYFTAQEPRYSPAYENAAAYEGAAAYENATARRPQEPAAYHQELPPERWYEAEPQPRPQPQPQPEWRGR